MGLGGISPWSLVLILLIVVLLFGTKKLRGIGGDLGGALKNFKKAMSDDDSEKDKLDTPEKNPSKEQDPDTSKNEKNS